MLTDITDILCSRQGAMCHDGTLYMLALPPVRCTSSSSLETGAWYSCFREYSVFAVYQPQTLPCSVRPASGWVVDVSARILALRPRVHLCHRQHSQAAISLGGAMANPPFLHL